MKDIDAELAAITNNWNRKYNIYKQRNTLSWLCCSLLLEALLVLVGGIQRETEELVEFWWQTWEFIDVIATSGAAIFF